MAANQNVTEKDVKRFLELTRMTYANQAKWFLNGFWATAEKETENVWKFAHKFIELDEKKGKAGCELDEFQAHRFLESLGETLTILELRARLRQIDMDANGKMALLEYLLFRYKHNVHHCVNNPQGGQENQKEIDEAAAMVEQLNAALVDLAREVANQQKALAEQKIAEADVRKAEEELRLAVSALHKEQEAHDKAIEESKRKAEDPALGAVARGRAAQEFAQLRGKDPLPLNRAKLTQGAALKKVEQERKLAQMLTAKAEEMTRKVEADQKEAEHKAIKAAEFLHELKMKGGAAYGSLWWMDREVLEAQKYLPKSKQVGVAKR